MRIKTSLFAFLLLAFSLPALGSHARAGLLFDAGSYSRSVHGDLDCGDCHYDIQDMVDAGAHPDPAEINKAPAAFDPSQCLDCHPGFEDDLARGVHAGMTVDDPEQYRDCMGCHDPHTEEAAPGIAGPADLSDASWACMRCHQAEPAGGPAENEFCLSCHQAGSGMDVVLLDRGRFAQTPHSAFSCTACHEGADSYPHSQRVTRDCKDCHDERHTESEIHDPHIGVSCQACHLGGPSTLHAMRLGKDEGCQRCHFQGNQAGAAAMVLPAKSFLCMACHAATPTLGDTASLLGFGVFAIGMFLALAPLCLVGVRGRKGSGGPGPVSALGAVFFDGLLQRRLYRRSPYRWFVHALIFQPFVIRFLWGLAAMIGSYAAPDAGWTLFLINKNNPLTALVFDLTGLALLAGCVLALVRGAKADKDLLPGLPRQDKAALWLLLAAVLLGFVTEGARMALTGLPDGSGFGFVGALFATLFPQGAASTVYGWLWYAHAIAWCAFVAYLPFSRLRHIIMAPIVLAMNAGKKHGH